MSWILDLIKKPLEFLKQKFVGMEEFEWNIVNEGHLLESMVGHKPVGVNKYFQMAFICDKFTDNVQKEISSDKIWSHLGTMYNLEALDESESMPFPNSEKEFTLPESEFAALIAKKDEDKKSVQKGRETPKKELKKEEKTPSKAKEQQRRDSKDSKEKPPVKKEPKKEVDKTKTKGKNSNNTTKEDKGKKDDTPKPAKRNTRGSLKPDDSSSSGKSSPIPATPPTAKRRRI